MLETKPYHLTQKRYTEIVIKKRFKKSWWLFAIMIVFSIIKLDEFGKDSFATFIVIFGLMYPLIVLLYLNFWSRSKSHSTLFETMTMTFDNSNLYFERSGNESKIPAINIKNIVSEKTFWMLYNQQRNFIYVPKDIFYSKDDFNNFCKLMRINK